MTRVGAWCNLSSMGRAKRVDVGGLVYHALNRGNAGRTLFGDGADYAAFERVLSETLQRVDMRILSYCLMPNHWHLVLWPRRDGDLSAFMRWLTLTHTQRWHAARGTAGSGHVYQGRYRSFVIETEGYLVRACRYVERNALRAGLVKAAEDWRWGSLWRGMHPEVTEDVPALSDWPIERPPRWRWLVNLLQPAEDEQTLKRCVERGRPFGSDDWVSRMARRLGLEATLRGRGRPPK